MTALNFNGEEIPLEIVFSDRRRSWSISVNPEGKVTIRVPSAKTEKDAVKIAEEKADWIIKQRNKFLERGIAEQHYNTGDTITLFGETLKIVRSEGTASAKISDGVLNISVPKEFSGAEAESVARDTVIFLYRRLGLKVLDDFVCKYSEIENVAKPAVRIRIQERKWGCCTPRNGIIINARVLLAPKIVAEYLVVHEVVHIRFRHHQISFWDEVARVMPNYMEAERLLKEDGWKWVF
ncbi:MAG: SprT family zinc-dependent metalloprotease [Methanocorpusculum sp.]|nr:SprT family zinc-dependent metalloprotease [Methanocorpusculum sp.]